MNRVCVITFGILTSAALCLSTAPKGHEIPSQVCDLPPLETFILQPISVDTVSIWVPADRSGPIINRGCGPQRNSIYSCFLPAGVYHTKAEDCPDGLARMLAEQVAAHYEQTLPLTIFNGWQWEYSCSLCQFESTLYSLAPRGGSWENSLEAVLTRTLGSITGEWVRLPGESDPPVGTHTEAVRSHIEITTFDSVRTRDGYPKIRQL